MIKRYVPGPTAEQLLSAAIASGDVSKVEVDWDEELLEEDLVELIADVISETAQLDVRWVDEGIGGYEYWGARGVDVNWCTEVDEDSHAIIAIPGAPANLPLPEVQTVESGGGCDGDHNGRCRACCQPWHVDITWKPDHHERHDGTLFVLYFAEAA
jgi:hypothetical protein